MARKRDPDRPKKSMTTIYMENEYIEEIDIIVVERGFKSRNQAIRSCLIDFINEHRPTFKTVLDEIAEM